MRPTSVPTRAKVEVSMVDAGSLRLSVNLPLYIERLSFWSTPPMSDTTHHAAKTVLVVDDHEPTRQTIARMLEAGGFAVRTASNGPEALEMLAARRDEI